jgi:hypothetical protein
MKVVAKVGIGCAAVVAIVSVAVVLLAPTLVREASRVVGPVQRMKRSQTALDDMAERAAWKRPETDALSPEQLDRFFGVRKRVDTLRRTTDLRLDQLPRKHVRTLEELKQVPGVIQGVSDMVGAEMDAFVEAGMPPAEYHWIERLVYQRWRGPLRKAGTYPVAVRAAAAEIIAAAGHEPDARVRARLERLAGEMSGRTPEPPDGFDAGIHALLLSRIDEVERWSLDDVAVPFVSIPR